ncbi:MAG: aminotransferase class V-fold PLP-dependent enzyme [Thaumarchaeota archaeon]|nr:aminotransferase class V-fold PLP-dependent enzyme [Nitrososphaerota archaeon]
MAQDFYPTPKESLSDIIMNSEFSDVSKDFPSKDKIYLNNASVSLMPFSSIEAMSDFQLSYNSMGPDSIESDVFIKEKLIAVRKSVANLIKCQPEEVVLTQSTTDGVNIVANGLLLDSNSNIIIRGKDHEHHANYFPWLRLSKKSTIKSLEVDKMGFFDIKKLYNLVDKNTKIVTLSHALYNTGAILPVEEIGDFLEKNNVPFFLDSAQTVGCIGDYDFKKTKCNFMSFNGSKWLCGPMGTGIFFCKKGSSDLLEPITVGGESAMLYDNSKLAYKDIPDKFQTGFRNYVGIVGLESSVSYLLKYGLENIHSKITKLANLFCDELSKIPGITVYRPEKEAKRNSIVSFSIDGFEPQVVIEKLDKQKIVLAVREIFDQKIIRVAPHFFNTESEMLKVVEAIKGL